MTARLIEVHYFPSKGFGCVISAALTDYNRYWSCMDIWYTNNNSSLINMFFELPITSFQDY